MKSNRNRPGGQPGRGFTLIEIVLVLAIGGLIMVVVFIALSGAQKNRRDFQRKHYMGLAAAAVENYFNNNNYTYPDPANPASIAKFESQYLPKTTDPLTGLQYSDANGNFEYRGVGGTHSDKPPVGTIYFQYAHFCNRPGRPDIDGPDDIIAGNDTGTYYVIYMGMENGEYSCLDNYTD
jgi:prepilin-type N-terminal cleavage/methylation domain-containing protein